MSIGLYRLSLTQATRCPRFNQIVGHQIHSSGIGIFPHMPLLFCTDYNPLTLVTPHHHPAMFWSSELPCPETRENCYICISALLRTVLPLGYYWGYYRSHPTILQFLLSIFVVNMSTLSSEKVISRDSNPGPLSLYLNVLPLHHWPDQRHTTPLPVLDRS